MTTHVAALPSNYRPTSCPNYTPPQQGRGRGYNLFVGTLPKTVVKEDLEILFSPFGGLTDTYLLKQEGMGKWRCGFVSFSDYPAAAHAIARLNGFKVHPNTPPLCVRFANPLKPDTPPSQPTPASDTESLTSSLGPDSATENPVRPPTLPPHVFDLSGLQLPQV